MSELSTALAMAVGRVIGSAPASAEPIALAVAPKFWEEIAADPDCALVLNLEEPVPTLFGMPTTVDASLARGVVQGRVVFEVTELVDRPPTLDPESSRGW